MTIFFPFTNWVEKKIQEPWGLSCCKEEGSNMKPFLGPIKMMGEEAEETSQEFIRVQDGLKGMLLLNPQKLTLD